MKCSVCKQPFRPTSYTPQKYCSKECQRVANLQQQKFRYHTTKITPSWTCSNCGYKTKLNFYPHREPQKWLKYKCKNCGNKAQTLTNT